jgi:hypothetical protein
MLCTTCLMTDPRDDAGSALSSMSAARSDAPTSEPKRGPWWCRASSTGACAAATRIRSGHAAVSAAGTNSC